jgi:flagellar protein FlbD
MIVVTRLNGSPFALNPDLIERAESTPDTIITLVDGTKFVVAEPLTELVELVRKYRALVIARAQAIGSHPSFGPERPSPVSASTSAPADTSSSSSNVVPLRRREQ